MYWLQNGQLGLQEKVSLILYQVCVSLLNYFRVDKDKSGAISSDELQSALSNGQHIL